MDADSLPSGSSTGASSHAPAAALASDSNCTSLFNLRVSSRFLRETSAERDAVLRQRSCNIFPVGNVQFQQALLRASATLQAPASSDSTSAPALLPPKPRIAHPDLASGQTAIRSLIRIAASTGINSSNRRAAILSGGKNRLPDSVVSA